MHHVLTQYTVKAGLQQYKEQGKKESRQSLEKSTISQLLRQ